MKLSARTVVPIVATAMLLVSCRQREQAPAARSTNNPAATTASSAASQPAAAPATDTASTATIEIGSAMPAYTAKMLDGQPFVLEKTRGKVVFLNLWATWCGPCRGEIPQLQALHDKYASKNFEVVGISLDESGVDSVKRFVAAQKMTYPIAIDPEGRIADELATSVLPTSVLLDRHGKVVWKQFGAVSATDPALQNALTAALNQT